MVLQCLSMEIIYTNDNALGLIIESSHVLPNASVFISSFTKGSISFELAINDSNDQ